jgi:predicted outer membrane repeat protein
MTIPYSSATFAGTIQTSSFNWQILNATQVDTCDFSLSNVAAFTMIFVVPTTGFYSLNAAISAITSPFELSTWNFMARTIASDKGSGCCGNTAFCGSLSATSQKYLYPRLFIRAGDTISIVWSAETVENVAPSSSIYVSIQAIREPVVYVDMAQGKTGNAGTFDEPVASLQEGLYALANLVATFSAKNLTATMLVRPSVYNQNKAHIPQLTTGFIIPNALKNAPLVISSLVAQRATTVYTAFKEQSYCNYLIKNCTGQSRFFETSYATAMDTEITANASVPGRAFTLKDVYSLTLQGFTLQNFANRGDGGVFYLENSTLIVKNCMFKNNFANAYGNGGAIYATKTSFVLVQDSIFLAHRARGSGGIVYANSGSTLVIDRSILQGTRRCPAPLSRIQ